MRRSKLEMYVDILRVLARWGPLSFSHVMNKVDVNGGILTEYLDFLIEKGSVEERTIKNGSAFFAVTQKGINLLKVFREFTETVTAS